MDHVSRNLTATGISLSFDGCFRCHPSQLQLCRHKLKKCHRNYFPDISGRQHFYRSFILFGSHLHESLQTVLRRSQHNLCGGSVSVSFQMRRPQTWTDRPNTWSTLLIFLWNEYMKPSWNTIKRYMIYDNMWLYNISYFFISVHSECDCEDILSVRLHGRDTMKLYTSPSYRRLNDTSGMEHQQKTGWASCSLHPEAQDFMVYDSILICSWNSMCCLILLPAKGMWKKVDMWHVPES